MGDIRNTTDNDFDKMAVGALTQLVDQIHDRIRKSDPDFRELINRQYEKGDRLDALREKLDTKTCGALDEYIAIMLDCCSHMMESMYIRGAKDYILLLNEYPECR